MKLNCISPVKWFAQALLFVFLGLSSLSVQAQPSGAELYNNNCAACHRIDQDLVGPALQGVFDRRDEAWLIKWIRNSAAMIAAGDETAVQLFNDWNKVAMPAYDWTDDEIKSVLAFIKEQEAEVSSKQAAAGGDGAVGGGGKPKSAFGNAPLVILAFIMLGAMILYAGRVVSARYKLKGVRLFDWNSINGALFLVFLVVGMGLVGLQFARYMRFTLPEAASEHGVVIDQMLVITFAITFVMFVLTHILLFVYAWIYRRKGNETKALFYPDNHKLEFFWTVIPAIVLTVLVLYGTKVWREITQGELEENPVELELFAFQFGWQARFPGADGVLGAHDYRMISATNSMGIDAEDPNAQDDLLVPEVYLPVNRQVILRLRARDVIHSAYLPHFRVQMNVVPGMPTQFVFTPTITTEEMRVKTNNYNFNYELACNKICGAAHFNMRMKFVVVSEAEYEAWLSKQRTYFRKAETQTASIH
ncbi:MAG: c-type cytochrome [Bacteroidia bacterium]